MSIENCPERDLLVAASCRPSSSAAVVDRLLRTEVSWTRLAELCLRHRVAPSLLAALETADPELVPVDFHAALLSHCRGLHEQSVQLTAELFAILEELRDRGVDAIPFKGPLLGQLVFGDMKLRTPGDLDLLVRRHEVAEVRQVLAGRGYEDAGGVPDAPPLTDVQRRMYEQFQCEYTFMRTADELIVEPHWELSQRPLALDVDYGGMLDRARPTELCGRAVTLLAPDDLLLALCVHGAKHQWQRLAWIRDVAAVLSKWPKIDLEALTERARGSGCERLLLVSLDVVSACAGTSLPTSVAQAICRDGTVGDLRSEVLDQLFDESQTEPRNDRVDSFRLRLRERWSDQLRYAVLTWLTPRRHHLEAVSLPVGLRWGYYPLKVGADLAMLPVWEAIKAVKSRNAARKSSQNRT